MLRWTSLLLLWDFVGSSGFDSCCSDIVDVESDSVAVAALRKGTSTAAAVLKGPIPAKFEFETGERTSISGEITK